MSKTARITLADVSRILEEVNAELADKKITLSLAKDTAERRRGAEIVRDAFMDYEMIKWMLEDFTEKERERPIEFFGRLLGTVCWNAGFVMVARDAQGDIVGVSHVELRGMGSEWRIVRWAVAFIIVMKVIGSMMCGFIGFPFFYVRMFLRSRKLLRRTIALDALEIEHTKAMDPLIGPGGPHIYLIQIATDPKKQSSGVGSAMLKALGRMADTHNLYTFLETDTERLRGFYERNGFRVERPYIIKDKDKPFEPNFAMVRKPIARDALTMA